MMRVDDVADRFARNVSFHRGDHGVGAGIAERAFHQRDVVPELDRHAVVAFAGEVIDAVADFRDVHLRRGRRCREGAHHRIGDRKDLVRVVRVGPGDLDVQHREAALLLDDVARHVDVGLHFVEQRVVREARLVHHVAEHRVIDPGLDLHHNESHFAMWCSENGADLGDFKRAEAFGRFAGILCQCRVRFTGQAQQGGFFDNARGIFHV